MVTEEDFQIALAAEPNNVDLRGIFSDWLEEHNDWRTAGYRWMWQNRKTPCMFNGRWGWWLDEALLSSLPQNHPRRDHALPLPLWGIAHPHRGIELIHSRHTITFYHMDSAERAVCYAVNTLQSMLGTGRDIFVVPVQQQDARAHNKATLSFLRAYWVGRELFLPDQQAQFKIVTNANTIGECCDELCRRILPNDARPIRCRHLLRYFRFNPAAVLKSNHP